MYGVSKMRFKDFEVRPTQPEKDADENLQYEVVKWHATGGSCFVIGFLTRDGNEDWEFRSVGMRYFQHRTNGLEEYIMAYCNLIDACLKEEKDESSSFRT